MLQLEQTWMVLAILVKTVRIDGTASFVPTVRANRPSAKACALSFGGGDGYISFRVREHRAKSGSFWACGGWI